jgi:multidrug transporter EmrE-like cation transporter
MDRTGLLRCQRDSVAGRVAYPMLSIGYVVNAFAAAVLFGEALSAGKLAAIALICAGVFMLARMQHS